MRRYLIDWLWFFFFANNTCCVIVFSINAYQFLDICIQYWNIWVCSVKYWHYTSICSLWTDWLFWLYGSYDDMVLIFEIFLPLFVKGMCNKSPRIWWKQKGKFGWPGCLHWRKGSFYSRTNKLWARKLLYYLKVFYFWIGRLSVKNMAWPLIN